MHRTARGLEIGGEHPSGDTQGAVIALFRAVATTWRLRKTLWVLVLKDFKSRYRAQALGLVWSFAYPLVMMVTITIAFDYILRVPIPHFPIFYLVAAVFWQWFSNATLAATGTFIDNGALVKKTTFPRYLLPIASVLANGINFLMEWLLVFAFYFIFPAAYRFNITLVALPLLAVLQLVMMIGVSLITSTLNVRYRDVYYIVTSMITIGFWASPILYSTAMAPEWLRRILRLNPLSGVMEGARRVVMHGTWPDPPTLLPGLATALVVFIVGCIVFRAQNLRLSDHV
jgi:lipopolysaccharide transport system permease protein